MTTDHEEEAMAEALTSVESGTAEKKDSVPLEQTPTVIELLGFLLIVIGLPLYIFVLYPFFNDYHSPEFDAYLSEQYWHSLQQLEVEKITVDQTWVERAGRAVYIKGVSSNDRLTSYTYASHYACHEDVVLTDGPDPRELCASSVWEVDITVENGRVEAVVSNNNGPFMEGFESEPQQEWLKQQLVIATMERALDLMHDRAANIAHADQAKGKIIR